MWKVTDCRAILSFIVVMALLGAAAPAGAESPVADRTAESASGATSTAGGPRVQFTVLEHDFGQALSGEDLRTKFTFKNVGDGVLVIEKVKGG